MNSNSEIFSVVGLFILVVVAVVIFLLPNVEELSSAVESVQAADLYNKTYDLEEINIQQILTNTETQIYWGENEDIGSNFYLTTVGELFDENSHPLEKHGVKAVLTLTCIANGRGVMELKREDDGRKAVICSIDINDLLSVFTLEEIQKVDPEMTLEKLSKYDGKFGVGIFENDGVSKVTLFIKENLKRLPQVVRYLSNVGYK